MTAVYKCHPVFITNMPFSITSISMISCFKINPNWISWYIHLKQKLYDEGYINLFAHGELIAL